MLISDKLDLRAEKINKSKRVTLNIDKKINSSEDNKPNKVCI